MSSDTPRERDTDSGDDKIPLEQWLGGRGARLTAAQKRRIKKYLLDRDGPRCTIATCPHPEEALPDLNLTIHHRDGNAANHAESNLALAHNSCNAREIRVLRPTHHEPVPYREIERKRKLAALAPSDVRETSTEIELNRDYEPIFRRKCFELVKKVQLGLADYKFISRKNLRIAARAFVGCGAQTSYSYMEPLFDEESGPFREMIDIGTQDHYVIFRRKEDVKLPIEALEAKYPKTGKRYSKEI